MGKYALLTVETCAYAASGNVLKVQKLLDICGDHLEDKNLHQAIAVLGKKHPQLTPNPIFFPTISLSKPYSTPILKFFLFSLPPKHP